MVEKWQTEVALADLNKYLTQTYDHKLKNGEARKRDKYRLSYIDKAKGTAIVNDTTDAGFLEYAKKKSVAKNAKRKEKLDVYREKVKEMRNERNEMKKALKQAEKGQRSKLKRIESKKNKMKQLEKELQVLEKTA